jgi:hypothetical protein
VKVALAKHIAQPTEIKTSDAANATPTLCFKKPDVLVLSSGFVPWALS